jgi:aldehyde dehydrogenase (NAD+)
MHRFLKDIGISADNLGGCTGNGAWLGSGETIVSVDPETEKEIASVTLVTTDEYHEIARRSRVAFHEWSSMPAPRRGLIVKELGDALSASKVQLGMLVSLEMGKIRAEGEGEVQEAIDMAGFACGLSRQLYGKTMPSERADHRLYEQWHPLGPIGIITAFNFPMAVWGWNAMIALVCGDTTIWKPSSKVPLCAIAIQHIANRVMEDNGVPNGVCCLACGEGGGVGRAMTEDPKLPLVSATGSVPMGRRVGQAVAARLGRSILELGGNNGVIVTQDADLQLAVKAIVFGAVGTTGQRCTSIRRLIVHRDIKDALLARLVKAYASLKIGNPLEGGTNVGPLIDRQAVTAMMDALSAAREQGGVVLYGGEHLGGNHVRPAIVEVPGTVPIVMQETFAPILYVMEYEDMEEAIALHNEVPQGLSSAIFSNNVKETELFLSHRGSDCGIANVNVSTSGAEIGGAFGGEKETGGGREAGSDAWKAYMRRQTVTVNWSDRMPLSQGLDFSY